MTSRINEISLYEQVIKLPRVYEATVPDEYLDLNGHMNVMYYTHVGNLGLARFFGRTSIYPGMLEGTYRAGRRGMFALKQVLSYLSELRGGEQFAVHSGLVNYDSKRMHFIHYIVSLSHNRVASVDERMAMYVDLVTRRSAEFEPHILAELEKMHNFFSNLGWTPELSGAIQLKEKPSVSGSAPA